MIPLNNNGASTGSLLTTGDPGSGDRWLREAWQATSQGLGLSPRIRQKLNIEPLLKDLDEERLDRLIQPLALTRPAVISRQLRESGGAAFLFSDPSQAAIASWGVDHQVISMLQENLKAVSALLKAYRKGELENLQAVLRALPVLAMSAVVPGGDKLREDLAYLLGILPQDTGGLIKAYAAAALLGDPVRIYAIDHRILTDPTWSEWVHSFLGEGKAIIRLSRPVTHWEFAAPSEVENYLNQVCEWLFRKE